jgi:hypothetical protein
MTLFVFANNVNTTLASGISPTATSLTLSSYTGLPSSIPAGYVLVITLMDQATRSVFEVIYASAVSGATLSGLARGQEGTSGLSWLTNDFAYSAPTAGQMTNCVQLPALGAYVPIAGGTMTGPLGIGASAAGYELNVAAPGNNTALFSANGAYQCGVYYDAPSGQQSALFLTNATVNKWVLLRTASNLFQLIDSVNNKAFLTATAGGSLNLGPAQNVTISQTGLTAFAVSPTMPTPVGGANNSQGAPTAYVDGAVNGAIEGIKTALNGATAYAMPGVTDLNSPSLGWNYYGATAANAPVSGSYGSVLTVSSVGTIPASSGQVQQFATDTGGNPTYFRQNINNTGWTAWQQFATAASVTAAVGVETSRAEAAESAIESSVRINLTTSAISPTVPAGIGHINILCAAAAGGGGGYGASTSGPGGSGGGGGNAVISQIIAVTPGHVITITPGAAGVGGTSSTGSTNGGNTTVVDTTTSTTLLTLNGGVGGGASGGTAGAAGGAGGQPGIHGIAISTWSFPGSGGSSLFGMAGIGTGSVLGTVGQNAGGYGGGGSGGGGNNGGNGSNGMVEWQWVQ